MAALRTCFALRPSSIALRRSLNCPFTSFVPERNAQVFQPVRLISTTPPLNGPLMKKYEDFIEHRYPRFYRLHRLISDGSKLCYNDLKSFWYIRKDLKNGKRTLNDLNARELAIYIETVADLPKVASVLTIAVAPTGFFILAFGIFFSPRFFLTRHFWTEDQRKYFWSQKIAERSKRHFPALSKTLKKCNPGVALTLDDVSQIKVPSIEKCSMLHRFHLTRAHGALFMWSPKRLKKHAEALQRLDNIMASNLENVRRLSGSDLYKQLFLRKIYYDDYTSVDQMRDSLCKWLSISPSFTNESLYLHLPLLIKLDEERPKAIEEIPEEEPSSLKAEE